MVIMEAQNGGGQVKTRRASLHCGYRSRHVYLGRCQLADPEHKSWKGTGDSVEAVLHPQNTLQKGNGRLSSSEDG